MVKKEKITLPEIRHVKKLFAEGTPPVKLKFEKATICPECDYFDRSGSAICPECGSVTEKYLEA